MELNDKAIAAVLAVSSAALAFGVTIAIYSGLIASNIVGGVGIIIAAVSLFLLIESFYSLT